MDLTTLIVIGFGVAFVALNMALRRLPPRDRGFGDDVIDLRPPGEPGNRGDTDVGWPERW
jgi:hypothetical protein